MLVKLTPVLLVIGKFIYLSLENDLAFMVFIFLQTVAMEAKDDSEKKYEQCELTLFSTGILFI